MKLFQPKITINRIFSNENKTLSECFLTQLRYNYLTVLLKFKGIELPWEENKPNISCISAGIYTAIAMNRYSNGDYAIWIQDVPGRSQILIHSANFVRDLRGCHAPGTEFKDIDQDRIIDVRNSRAVMRQLEKHLPVGTELQVHFIDVYRVMGNAEIKA